MRDLQARVNHHQEGKTKDELWNRTQTQFLSTWTGTCEYEWKRGPNVLLMLSTLPAIISPIEFTIIKYLFSSVIYKELPSSQGY